MKMTFSRSALASLALTTLLTLPSCASLGMGLPGVIQNIGGLAGKITNWKSGLSGLVSDAAVKQLGGFAGQAGPLADTLKGLVAKAAPAQRNTLDGVASNLKDLSSFKTDNILQMSNSGRQAQVDKAGNIASNLTDLVKRFTSAAGK